MVKERQGRPIEPRYTIPERVLRLRKYHHLIDAYTLMGWYAVAERCREKAFEEGMQLITIAANHKKNEQTLARTLDKLKEIDREMYGEVTRVLDSAQAVKDMRKLKKNS